MISILSTALYFIHIIQVSQNPLPFVHLQKIKIEVINIQPFQILNCPLPSLPYSLDTPQFIKKFNFQYSDDTDDNFLKL